MWNQLFLNKKTQCEWLRRCRLVCIYWVSAALLLLQCEAQRAAAAVADLRRLVLSKAAALLVVGTQRRCNISANPARKGKTSADWVSLCTLVLLCIASPCFCVLCFCSGGGMCVCVYVWWYRLMWGTLLCLSVSLHNNACVPEYVYVQQWEKKCVTICVHPGSGSVHLILSMYETVCMKCKHQYKLHAKRIFEKKQNNTHN